MPEYGQRTIKNVVGPVRAAAEMHSGFNALRSYCPFHAGGRFDKTPLPDAVLTDLKRLEQLWQEGLQRFGGPYLAGAHFSAVDAFYAPVLFRIQSYQLPVAAPCFALYRADAELTCNAAMVSTRLSRTFLGR